MKRLFGICIVLIASAACGESANIDDVEPIQCVEGPSGWSCSSAVTVGVYVSNESTEDYRLDVSVTGGLLTTELTGQGAGQGLGPTERITVSGLAPTCAGGDTDVRAIARLHGVDSQAAGANEVVATTLECVPEP